MAYKDLERLAKEFSEGLARKLKSGAVVLDEMPILVAEFLANLN